MTSATLDHSGIRLSGRDFDVLFREARTFTAWLDRRVEDSVLRELYDLLKWGPTSANCCPARILFLRSPESRERLRPALVPGNVEKTMKAPVTAVIGFDSRFFELLPRLFPAAPAMKGMFEKSPELAASTAMRNGSLQAAYLMIAARSLGLDCGPMSGFDNAKVDAEFFSTGASGPSSGGLIAEGPIKSNFLCNLGYGDASTLHPRGPRLLFGEACQLL